MGLEIQRLNSILSDASFQSEVSKDATNALKKSILLRKSHKKSKSFTNKNISLDFTKINKIAINKRGNLKVYQDLPKGIRIVAR